MTYNDFLEFIFTPITYFVNWLSMVANSLLHNYIFITILGLVVCVSMFWFLYNTIFGLIYHKIDEYDDYNDKYNNYKLNKKIQYEYLKNHRVEEFMYLYDYIILKYQVLNGIYQNHKDLLLENKVNNIQLYIDSLKKLKQNNLSDNDDSNNDDVDMIIPNPPIQQATIKELKSKLSLQNLEDLKQDNKIQGFYNNKEFNMISKKMNNEVYSKYNVFFDTDSLNYFDSITGELISFDDVLKRIHTDNVLSKFEKSSFINNSILSGEPKELKVNNLKLRSNLLEHYDNL